MHSTKELSAERKILVLWENDLTKGVNYTYNEKQEYRAVSYTHLDVYKRQDTTRIPPTNRKYAQHKQCNEIFVFHLTLT